MLPRIKTPNRQRELRKNALIRIGQLGKALNHLRAYIITTLEEMESTDFRAPMVFSNCFQDVAEMIEMVQGNYDIMMGEQREGKVQEAVDSTMESTGGEE